MAAAETRPSLPGNASAALTYERSLLANGLCNDDPFYTVPPDASPSAPPGTLLKVEHSTDTTHYSLPPATALSRFLYQTSTLQGKPVPASAYVLWPYHPRTLPDGSYPCVAWAHGTSGAHANGAPSNAKHLTQHFMAPYPLALHGYVVVAADYAGLGVGKTVSGAEILHQYAANPAQANDIVLAVQAAQKAFPKLSTKWVVMGHSQGGGAAWAVAERMAQQPADGYLGAIPISPVTNFLDLDDRDSPRVPLIAMYATRTMEQLYGDEGFRAKEDLFTDEGWERFQLELDVGIYIPVLVELLVGFDVLKEGWQDNPFLKRFADKTAAGGREIVGPMFVIQGEADPTMQPETTTKAVRTTRQACPKENIQYTLLPGLGHDATMYGSQRMWLEWIEKRFFGGPEEAIQIGQTPRPIEAYQADPNWVIKTASQP